ncbi:hypothetical protein D3C81_1886010 [compost metagenome]
MQVFIHAPLEKSAEALLGISWAVQELYLSLQRPILVVLKGELVELLLATESVVETTLAESGAFAKLLRGASLVAM